MSATGFLDACGFFPAAGGTADFVVSAAITGYQTPASAGAANGAVYSYRAQSYDLSQWEIGFGAYATGTTTLARTTVVASSTGSKVNFSAPPSVYVTALAADLKNAALLDNGQFGFHNRLINPSGKIWQRANNGAAAITDGVYAFDRWYGLTQSAGVTASQVVNAENGTPYMMRLAQANATAQRFGIAQAIESANCLDMRGQSVTLSARVRMSASTTLRYAIIEWTGTADAITKDVVADWNNTTFTPGNFFISTTTTVVAIDSSALTANTLATINLTGSVSGSMNNLIVFFWTDSAQAQNVTLDIGKVQFELGSSATPLALRSVTTERSLCEWYYLQSWGDGPAPASSSNLWVGTVIAAAQSYAIGSTGFSRMRTIPTVTLYDSLGASGTVSQPGLGNGIAATVTGATETGFSLVLKSSGTFSTSALVRAGYVANAEL